MACNPDFNRDGVVGIPDFPLLKDCNGDGMVGIDDFVLWRSVFGMRVMP